MTRKWENKTAVEYKPWSNFFLYFKQASRYSSGKEMTA